MKRYLLATVAVAALLPSGAFAQGWFGGPEIGIQGGYVFDGSSGNVSCPDGGEGFALAAVEATTAGSTCATDEAGGTDPIFHYRYNLTGWLGGAHAGYNWQWGHTVLGLEADAEGAGVTGGTAPAGLGFSVHSNMDFDASIRGKLGWAFDRILVYGTGGVAFGDVKTTYAFAAVGGGPLAPAGGTTGIRTGWTAGGGAAYAITPNWDLGLEYRYTDLGTHNYAVAALGVSDSNEFNFSAVRVSLTYRFAPPPPAPPAVVPVAAPAPAPMPMARTFLVFFDFDRYNLTPDARRVIDAAAGVYKAGGHPRIDVSGYTDLAGTQAYNLRLSQRRADAVAVYLMKQGVPKNAMDVKWFGKEHPRVPTADGVREPQNRRVEIVMP